VVERRAKRLDLHEANYVSVHGEVVEEEEERKMNAQ
jgi:hypothetical protein